MKWEFDILYALQKIHQPVLDHIMTGLSTIARPRPCWLDTQIALLIKSPKDYSFPSGHSMNGFAASIALLCNDKKLGIPAVILASLIAFSRLYHFVHFPTDVMVGILIGTTVAILVHAGYLRWRRRHFS